MLCNKMCTHTKVDQVGRTILVRVSGTSKKVVKEDYCVIIGGSIP